MSQVTKPRELKEPREEVHLPPDDLDVLQDVADVLRDIARKSGSKTQLDTYREYREAFEKLNQLTASGKPCPPSVLTLQQRFGWKLLQMRGIVKGELEDELQKGLVAWAGSVFYFVATRKDKKQELRQLGPDDITRRPLHYNSYTSRPYCFSWRWGVLVLLGIEREIGHCDPEGVKIKKIVGTNAGLFALTDSGRLVHIANGNPKYIINESIPWQKDIRIRDVAADDRGRVYVITDRAEDSIGTVEDGILRRIKGAPRVSNLARIFFKGGQIEIHQPSMVLSNVTEVYRYHPPDRLESARYSFYPLADIHNLNIKSP